MTPAEELRAAATRMDELAAVATPPPWLLEDPNEPDDVWCVVMSPQVRAPLVAWLRQAAERHGVRERAHASNVAQLPPGTEPWPPPVIDEVWRHALDFARAVNGSAS